MEYVSQSLVFTTSSIYCDFSNLDDEAVAEMQIHYVMMDWEDPIMSGSAAYVCENGGDILEIGFGMGISANYIQSHTINSHTIIENHPDIILKAQSWAADKSNVTIIEGDWYDVKDTLSTYDGLFYDTFFDMNYHHFSSSLSSLMKSGGKVTWFNDIPSENNTINIPGVTYDVYNISPPTNQYFNYSEYYLPKKQF
jgi:protein arginine N-methyltransferase 2|tara:strand:+ start:611 stop:1198 length:588 start_codon:yes stop_codon:yes gene_type:complete